MHVHEAGGDDSTRRVYLPSSFLGDRAERRDAPIDDAEIAADLGCPCAVNDAAVSDDQIEHLAPPRVSP